MKRNNTEQVGEVLRRLLRQEGLETPLNEYRLVDAWKDVVAKSGRQTTSIPRSTTRIASFCRISRAARIAEHWPGRTS